MPPAEQRLKHLYDRFNARDMDAVLAAMHPEVVWANGLEGGYVHGRDGVRAYWTKQWAAMDSRANPIGISITITPISLLRASNTGVARKLAGMPATA